VRLNNFDLTRLALAIAVVFEHAYLVGLGPLRAGAFGITFDGYAALQCFFVISGYLIVQSWENSKSVGSYVSKRIRRVYPAYCVIVIVMAGLGVFLTTLTPTAYFTSAEWIRYLLSNLLFLNFLQPTLPGVFTNSIEPVVNGPLWTIKVEVMFYMTVPLLALIRRRVNTGWLFAALYVASVAWAEVFAYLHVATGRGLYEVLGRQLPGQMSFFVSGGLLYYYFDGFKKRAHLLAPLALVMVIGHLKFGLPWLYPAALAVLVIYVAEILPYLGNFGRFGDMSYGLYIFHYPVLHVVAALGLIASPGGAFAVGFSTAMVLAYLSWHLIEKPALHTSSHYRAAEDGADAPALRSEVGSGTS
jgi:peptidoglycan/LPS O-acetylase OafA/YrhL